MTGSTAIRLVLWIAVIVASCAPALRPIAAGNRVPVPTFSREVAPILFKHCASCHQPGEIASAVSFLSYESSRPWAESIRDKISRREMPPWPADPTGSVKFRNAPTLTQTDIDTIVAWVNGGAPKGNDADLPPAPSVPQGWLQPQGRAPDLVIPLREIQIPATGEIPYVRYLVKVPYLDDKWVTAIQLRPGNRAVVHHMAITELALADGVTPADLNRITAIAGKLGLTGGSISAQPAVVAPGNPALHDMLGVYTPGTTFEAYGPDSAKLLRGGKNMYLNFNIHYQTTGQPEKDASTLGFWFQPDPPKHQLFRVPASGETILAGGKELLTDASGPKAEGTSVAIPPIPAYAENYEVVGITAYTEPVTIYQFQPHAHLRGKDFRYAVVYPDGREESVLNVPHYDFHWQLAYELDTPLQLPAGSKLVVTAHYDNSAKNVHLLHRGGHASSDSPHPPGPEKEVHFREENQSWDEMFTPFVQYTIDNQDLTKRTQPQPAENGQPSAARDALREHTVVPIAETVGCLEQRPSRDWTLTRAGEPILSKTQSTSSAALQKAAGRALGKQEYRLLGVDAFKPETQKGHKLAVKGVLIEGADDRRLEDRRLNVTSLQTVAATCD
ncbi:MAG TPA: hypothetical protein VNW47_10040 [Terriglobales bacterium]|jgi:hypothetical protein|nr:hypothetical protein [Terriglobales bacterium]